MALGWCSLHCCWQGVAAFLWTADRLPLAQAAVWLAVLTASLWALGAVLQGRIT
jgi:alkylglycerol monooxygenase